MKFVYMSRATAIRTPRPLRERPPGHVVAANYAHEPGGLFPHPLPSPEGRGGVGSLARFMGRGRGEGCHVHHAYLLPLFLSHEGGGELPKTFRGSAYVDRREPFSRVIDG